MSKLMIPLVLLSAVLPDAALAREAPTEVRVAYRDLNLQSPYGVKMLDRRIKRAIAAVCPDVASVDTSVKLAVHRCRAAKRAEVADQRTAVLENAARGNVELAAAHATR